MVERGGGGQEFEDVGAHFGGWGCPIDAVAVGIGCEGAVGADMVAGAGTVGGVLLGLVVAVEENGAFGDGIVD